MSGGVCPARLDPACCACCYDMRGMTEGTFRHRLVEFLAKQRDVIVCVGAYDDIDLARFVAKMLEHA